MRKGKGKTMRLFNNYNFNRNNGNFDNNFNNNFNNSDNNFNNNFNNSDNNINNFNNNNFNNSDNNFNNNFNNNFDNDFNNNFNNNQNNNFNGNDANNNFTSLPNSFLDDLFECYYLLHLAEIIESKNTCEKYSKINHVLYHQKVDFQKILANNILKSHINYHIKK